MSQLDTLDRPTTTVVSIPDGYALERIGQNWSVGPSGSDTHLIVTDLSQVPAAIGMFDAMVAHAAQIGADR